MTTVVTTSPGRGLASQGAKCTRRLSLARPDIRCVTSSFRPSPAATSTSTSRPANRRFPASDVSSTSATRRSYRSCTTSAGTCSSIVAAGVPGRVEYRNVNAPANLACRTTSRVSAKSLSVSPGNPTMMSVVIAASGIAARTLPRIPRYLSLR